MVAFIGLVLVMLIGALDATIVATALPTIVSDLGGGDRYSWVVTAYLLSFTIVTPLYGKLGDLFGRKRLLMVALILFLAGSITSGTAQSMDQLILFRFLQGIGGGGLLVGAQAGVADLFAPAKRGTYQGIMGAAFSLASVMGPLLGGMIVENASWRWIFLINVPIGIVAMILLRTLPNAAEKERKPIDWLGSIFLALTLVGVITLTTFGDADIPWTSGAKFMAVCITFGFLAAFVLAESRAKDPILPLELFKVSQFALSCIILLVVGLVLTGASTYLPIYWQTVKGMAPSMSGVELIPAMLGVVLTSLLSGRLISKTGRYRIFPILGMGLTALGLIALSTLSASTPQSLQMIYLFVLGAGLGCVVQVLVLATQNAVRFDLMGVATGGVTLFRSIGAAVGVAILGAIFSNTLAKSITGSMGADQVKQVVGMSPEDVNKLTVPQLTYVHDAYVDAIQQVFLASLPLALVAFFLAWFLREVKLDPERKGTGTAG
jgi:EmrB/QacA subfamily drug resistance transporter